ncbi:MAG: group III truncated hemoglobin [Acidobacteriaceae bacterium]|nr:group III truncated hemoglobin [Acidobacteriaceae bacterium]
MHAPITEAQIDLLVETFYARVRQDEEIGPIFQAVVQDWPHHLATLKDFWSSVLLATGRYKGDPMMRHLALGLDPQHFTRWLTLFAQTAREILPEATASLVIAKSQRIAQNLQNVLAFESKRPAR